MRGNGYAYDRGDAGISTTAVPHCRVLYPERAISGAMDYNSVRENTVACRISTRLVNSGSEPSRREAGRSFPVRSWFYASFTTSGD